MQHMDSSDLERRLAGLESRLAHFERMADELSDVMAGQADTIDKLTIQLRHLRDRQKRLEAGTGAAPPDDKPPPHY